MTEARARTDNGLIRLDELSGSGPQASKGQRGRPVLQELTAHKGQRGQLGQQGKLGLRARPVRTGRTGL